LFVVPLRLRALQQKYLSLVVVELYDDARKNATRESSVFTYLLCGGLIGLGDDERSSLFSLKNGDVDDDDDDDEKDCFAQHRERHLVDIHRRASRRRDYQARVSKRCARKSS